MTNPANANGHRRRELVKRIKANSTHCIICGQPLQPSRKYPDPLSTVIDEDLPRSRGGSPLDPRNCNAAHAQCNAFKGSMTLAETRQLLQLGANVNQPLTRGQRRGLLNPAVGSWDSVADSY